MIQYDKNKILINDKEYTFKNNILEAVSIESKLIIVFDTNEDEGYDNVYCYDNNQTQLWRIQPVQKKIGGTSRVPYVGVNIKDKICRVVDFFGRRFIVNIDNGCITLMDIVK